MKRLVPRVDPQRHQLPPVRPYRKFSQHPPVSGPYGQPFETGLFQTHTANARGDVVQRVNARHPALHQLVGQSIMAVGNGHSHELFSSFQEVTRIRT